MSCYFYTVYWYFYTVYSFDHSDNVDSVIKCYCFWCYKVLKGSFQNLLKAIFETEKKKEGKWQEGGFDCDLTAKIRKTVVHSWCFIHILC